MKLEDWLNVWLNMYHKYNIKLRTYNRYSEIIEKHINPELGGYDINDLKPEVLQKFICDKLENGNLNTSGGLSHNSVLSILSLLKLALKQAVVLGYCDKEYVSCVKVSHIKEKKVNAFSRKEQQVLESYCFNSKVNHLGIIICLYTGIRIGELLSLTWDDIDFDNRVLYINKTLYNYSENGKMISCIDRPKTINSNRCIPLSKKIICILKQIKKTSNSKYVISTRNGEMVQVRSYQKTFKLILDKCDISYRNFHSLRHTFATRALESGMDVKCLSEILGHKNSLVTLNRYSHTMVDYKSDMMNKLSNIFVY